MPTITKNVGVNTKLESTISGNTLKSNIQNGDINKEETENWNLDENIQKETAVFHTIHVNGDFTFNSGLGQHGGQADQSPKTKNVLSEAHALTMLFAFIGLAIFAIAIGFAISCCRRRRKKVKKEINQKIELHKEITKSQRELHLLEELNALKLKIENSRIETVMSSKNDDAQDISFSTSSDISEI